MHQSKGLEKCYTTTGEDNLKVLKNIIRPTGLIFLNEFFLYLTVSFY
jgi:hypothetical protein